MRHYSWGGAFVESNRDQIRRLLGARQCVTMRFRGENVTIPLTGPYGQFDEFFEMLKDQYSEKPIDFINISGELETVIAAAIDKIVFFRLRRSRNIAIFGLFEFNNKTVIDLSRYQIFKESDGDWDETEEPCLIHTLRICGIRESILLHLKANIPGYFVNRSILKKVAELSNVYIVFHYAGANELIDGSRHRTRKAYYGKPEDPTIKVACFQNHSFAFEDTVYSGYSIRNYDSVKSENEWWHIVGKDKNGKFIRKPNRPKLNSLELILGLFRNDLFEESRRYLRYPKFNHCAVLHDDLISGEQEPYHFKRKEPYDEPVYFMADLECATGGDRHVSIVSGFCCENGDFYQFVGSNCVSLMFDKIVQLSHGRLDVFVFFHNLKYDWAAMSRYIRNISTVCKKNNQLYTCLIYHRKRKII